MVLIDEYGEIKETNILTTMNDVKRKLIADDNIVKIANRQMKEHIRYLEKKYGRKLNKKELRLVEKGKL